MAGGPPGPRRRSERPSRRPLATSAHRRGLLAHGPSRTHGKVVHGDRGDRGGRHRAVRGARRGPRGGPLASRRHRDHDRRPDGRGDARDAADPAADRRRGSHLRQRVRLLPALLPEPGDVAADVPPGWDEWYGAVDPSTYNMWGYTLNENGTLRTYGAPRVEDPALYQTDVYRDKAIDVIRRGARDSAPLYLSVAFLAPHAEALRGARGAGPASVRSAPRHRDALAGEATPRPRSFDEADVSDKPALLGRNYARLTPAQQQAVAARYRGRLESLLA